MRSAAAQHQGTPEHNIRQPLSKAGAQLLFSLCVAPWPATSQVLAALWDWQIRHLGLPAPVTPTGAKAPSGIQALFHRPRRVGQHAADTAREGDRLSVADVG